jgi:hypothetical protein
MNFAKKSIVFIITFIFAVFLSLPAKAVTLPNDLELMSQSSMWSQIDAFNAWDISIGSKEIIVAVIDTGIDIYHPDLINNIWFNKNEIPDNDIDDDNNGFVDDINGWNFVDNNPNLLNYESESLDSDYYDIYTHGTIIAGLIGAIGNNNMGGLGVNWQVSIMPIKAFDSFGSGSYYGIGEAINYAIKNGADVINISFVGNLDEPLLKNSLRKAYEAGVLTVVAAGNNNIINRGDLDNRPMYPICYDKGEDNWILGVTSVDSQNSLSIFANYGTCVDIAAPGENIFSSIIKSEFSNNQYFGGPWDGTSFSTPLISGAAALIKSIDRRLTPAQIIKLILSTANDIEYANPGLAGRVGYGVLNLKQVLLKTLLNKKINYLPGRICRAKESKIICYEPDLSRDLIISDINKKIISVDAYKKEKIAVLTGDQAKIFSGNGSYEVNISLNSDYLYKKIMFFESNGQILLSILGSKNLTEHKIFIFDTSGNIKQEVAFGESRPFALTIIDNNYFATLKIENNRIAVSQYDFNGKLIFKKTGPFAFSFANLTHGRFWDNGEQLAFTIKQNGDEILCIFDLNTGSYFLDKDNVLAENNKLMSVPSLSRDELWHIMDYSPENGKYRIFDGKGNVLGAGVMNF